MLRALIVLSGLLVVSPVFASVESELVKQGLAAYDDLDYAKAIDLLHKALAETLTKEEKVITYKTLAFAEVAVDKPDEAQKDFEQLLTVDPSFQMDRTISPRVRVVFTKAQVRIATTGLPTPEGSGMLPSVTPRAPKEGQPLSITASYPGGVASRMVLFYRTRGQNRFNKVESKPSAQGMFFANIPGLQVLPPALEYYVNMVDDSGAGVASAGSLGRPLFVDVIAKPRPLYTKGWFWGVIGGVAVAGAVAAVLATTLPTHIGPNTPATLTIQPQ
jgi:hypothetical protein